MFKAEAGQKSRQKILVIEDDPSMTRLLKNMLIDEGFVVETANTPEKATAALRRLDIDLITLDLGLGHADGLAFARSLRAMHTTPFIIVSGKSDEIDRIVGLEIGADDYIIKPFNPREVLARVRAVLRRRDASHTALQAKNAQPTLAFEGFVFDESRRLLLSPTGDEITITAREFSLLNAFLQRPQRVLHRDYLLENVDGLESTALDRAVDTLVSRLRRKLIAAGASESIIKTVRGAGYLWSAKVTVHIAGDRNDTSRSTGT